MKSLPICRCNRRFRNVIFFSFPFGTHCRKGARGYVAKRAPRTEPFPRFGSVHGSNRFGHRHPKGTQSKSRLQHPLIVLFLSIFHLYPLTITQKHTTELAI